MSRLPLFAFLATATFLTQTGVALAHGGAHVHSDGPGAWLLGAALGGGLIVLGLRNLALARAEQKQ